MSSSTSELGKQYMLVVANTPNEAREMASAVHSELLGLDVEHIINTRDSTLSTNDKCIYFVPYNASLDDSLMGMVYSQIIMTEFSSEYDQNHALSRVRGKGEKMFKAGYNDMWEVVGLVNKFLGVSDE